MIIIDTNKYISSAIRYTMIITAFFTIATC